MMKGFEVITYIIFFLLVLNTNRLTASSSFSEEKSDSTDISLAELRTLYSHNKEIPVELEKAILTSLSYYPELKDVKIRFEYGNIFTSMKAVPVMGFLFQKRENRTYRIVMNQRKCGCGKNLMQRASFEALTGVIGHELGHIKDYHQRSNYNLFKLLVSYITRKSRMETEKRADKFAVEHHLGEQLLMFNNHIMNDSCMSPKYIQYKKKFYNSSTTLSDMITSYDRVSAF
jgi:hypothetical protein